MSDMTLAVLLLIAVFILIGIAIVILSIDIDRDNWKKGKIIAFSVAKALSGVFIALLVLAVLASGDDDTEQYYDSGDSYEYYEDESMNEYYNVP